MRDDRTAKAPEIGTMQRGCVSDRRRHKWRSEQPTSESDIFMQEGELVIVFDPRGRVEAEPVSPAPRITVLDDKRLGILDNTKWNAGRLLRRTAALLAERHQFASVNYYRKESFSKPADPALLAQIAAENDIVLTAIGD